MSTRLRLMEYAMVLIFALWACNTVLYAGISIAPPVVELRCAPGEKAKGKFTVKNTSDKPIEVLINTEVHNAETKKSIVGQGWLKLSKNRCILGPRKSQKVKYIINTPPDLSGELVTVAYFSTIEGKGEVAIGTRIGSTIYVAAKGTEVLDMEVKSIAADRVENGIKIKFIIENRGNTHIRPRGIIRLINGNKEIATPVQYGWTVFPGKEQIYEALIETQLADGIYKGCLEMRYGDLYKKRKDPVKKEINLIVENGRVTIGLENND